MFDLNVTPAVEQQERDLQMPFLKYLVGLDLGIEPDSTNWVVETLTVAI